MKIKQNMQDLFSQIRLGLKDYPMPAILSLITGLLLIFSSDRQVYNISLNFANNLLKLSKLGLVGMALFISLEDLKKKFGYKEFFYGLGAIFLLGFYLIYLRPDSYPYRRQISFIAALVIFYLISLSHTRDDYSRYTIGVLRDIAISISYTLVLLLGLIIILLTIENLFKIDYKVNVYLYSLIGSFFFFGFPIYLANISDKTVDLRYPKAFTSLINFVIIPLIGIYTMILYVYLGKILLSRTWPEGLVSHLVLWYSAFSILVLIVVDNFTSKMALYFKKIFPKVNLPLLLMMFISMGIRINQYGLSENRVFVLSLAMWVVVSLVYYLFYEGRRLEMIPLFLIVFIFLTIYSPLNAFKLSRSSQNKRLEKILLDKAMLVNGQVVRNPKLDRTSKYEISNMIEYFDEKHELKDIRILEDNFKTSHMEDVFGFEYEPDRNLGKYSQDYYSLDMEESFLELSGYDYILYGNRWETGGKDFILGDYSISMDLEAFKIVFNQGEDHLGDLMLEEAILNGLKEKIDREDSYGEDPILVEESLGDLKVKFIIRRIDGLRDDLSYIYDYDFILLVGSV